MSAKRRSNWSEVFRGAKFLWNKFFFFTVVGVALFSIGFYVHPVQRLAGVFNSLQVVADEPQETVSLQDENSYEIVIDVAEDGTLKVDGSEVSDQVEPSGNYDELRYVVYDGETKTPPKSYIGVLKITVRLPESIDETSIPENQRRLITAHGVAETLPSEFLNNKTIYFEAQGVVQTANVAVLINFPKGYLSLGTTSEIQRSVSNIPGAIWLALSIGLPMLSLIIMFAIYGRTTGESLNNPPKYILNSPPDNLSPAAVGVLAHGRIRPKELLAIIIDLSNKGFLGVEDRDGKLMVYKKNVHSDQWLKLRGFELTLVEELFGKKKTLNTAEEIKERESKELFSEKVTNIYEELYSDIGSMGLFDKNPAATHWRYRITGIFMFVLGVLGFVYGMVTAPEPKFTLFFWAGMVAVSLLTIFFASRISTRTPKGREELIKWLAFRNYLAMGKPVTLEDAQENEFEKYLPYAIALDVELEWAQRFSSVDFHLPAWYGAAGNILDVQGFANSFFPLLGRFTEQLSYLKEPVVD